MPANAGTPTSCVSVSGTTAVSVPRSVAAKPSGSAANRRVSARKRRARIRFFHRKPPSRTSARGRVPRGSRAAPSSSAAVRERGSVSGIGSESDSRSSPSRNRADVAKDAFARRRLLRLLVRGRRAESPARILPTSLSVASRFRPVLGIVRLSDRAAAERERPFPATATPSSRDRLLVSPVNALLTSHSRIGSF